jgi:anti-anti-sigma regulatory factor
MVAVDFSELTLMGLSGASVVVAGTKRTRDHSGTIVPVGMAERVRVPLDLTGVSEIVQIPSVNDLHVGLAAR